jgi:PHD/YefM family antitoxin component YafN of YafNO toxin-antitoxin module
MIVTANELKRKGISYISSLLEKFENVFISVRGKKKYVILKIEDYERLKELELENAIREAERDLREGKYVVETAEEHFKRLGI